VCWRCKIPQAVWDYTALCRRYNTSFSLVPSRYINNRSRGLLVSIKPVLRRRSRPREVTLDCSPFCDVVAACPAKCGRTVGLIAIALHGPVKLLLLFWTCRGRRIEFAVSLRVAGKVMSQILVFEHLVVTSVPRST